MRRFTSSSARRVKGWSWVRWSWSQRPWISSPRECERHHIRSVALPGFLIASNPSTRSKFKAFLQQLGSLGAMSTRSPMQAQLWWYHYTSKSFYLRLVHQCPGVSIGGIIIYPYKPWNSRCRLGLCIVFRRRVRGWEEALRLLLAWGRDWRWSLFAPNSFPVILMQCVRTYCTWSITSFGANSGYSSHRTDSFCRLRPSDPGLFTYNRWYLFEDPTSRRDRYVASTVSSAVSLVSILARDSKFPMANVSIHGACCLYVEMLLENPVKNARLYPAIDRVQWTMPLLQVVFSWCKYPGSLSCSPKQSKLCASTVYPAR